MKKLILALALLFTAFIFVGCKGSPKSVCERMSEISEGKALNVEACTTSLEATKEKMNDAQWDELVKCANDNSDTKAAEACIKKIK